MMAGALHGGYESIQAGCWKTPPPIIGCNKIVEEHIEGVENDVGLPGAYCAFQIYVELEKCFAA